MNLRLLLIALCWLGLGAGQAEAENSHRVELWSGNATPQWAYPGSADDLDFASQRYFGAALGSTTYARAGTATDLLSTSPAGAAFNTFGPNVIRLTPGRGVLIEAGRTNFLVNSTAPATQTTGSLSTGTYELWVNGSGNIADTVTMSSGSGTGCGAGVASQGSPVVFTMTVAGTCVVTVAGTPKAFQLEKTFGEPPTSLIVTAGAPVTRQNDVLTAIGKLKSDIQGTKGTVIIAAGIIPNAANTPYLIGGLGLDGVNNQNGTAAVQYNGSTVISSSGANALLNATKTGFTWGPASRAITYSGAASVTTDANGVGTQAATVTLGEASNSRFLDGYISRLTVFTQPMSNTQLFNLVSASASQSIMAWGDSLTVGDNDSRAISYPVVLANSYAPSRTVFNEGVGGQNSTQILARFQALSASWGLPTIIWSGRNNYSGPVTVENDIATMVGDLTTSKYLVLGIINEDVPAEQSGGVGYNQIINLNTTLASTYGSHYIDVRANLVAAYDPSNPVDVLNHSQDVVPMTLRAFDQATGALPAPIGAGDQTFAVPGTVFAGDTLLIDSEYIYVSTVTGASTVQTCTRGYGTGGIAASHLAGAAVTSRTPLHLGTGYNIVAANVYAYALANAW